MNGTQIFNFQVLFIWAARFYRLLMCSVLFSLLTGCVTQSPSPELQQLTQLPNSICKIAVLPFIDEGEYPRGGEIFYRIFMAGLNKNQQHFVVQEGDVRKILRQMRISPLSLPKLDQMIILADRLGVDALVTGTIVSMEENTTKSAANPSIKVNLKLIDASTGKTILSTYHARKGKDYQKIMHFGLVSTVSELSGLVSNEIYEIWKKKGLSQCLD